MIVVGVDPGARSTGLAVIATDGKPGEVVGPPALVGSRTLVNPSDESLTHPPRPYLELVLASIVSTMIGVRRDLGLDVDLIAVERVDRPHWHHRGKAKPVDPSAIIGTGIVFGAVFGRSWTVPIVAIPPLGNGSHLPLDRYPEPLATTGRGQDKRRHERSAYDVAVAGIRRHGLPNPGGYA